MRRGRKGRVEYQTNPDCYAAYCIVSNNTFNSINVIPLLKTIITIISINYKRGTDFSLFSFAYGLPPFEGGPPFPPGGGPPNIGGLKFNPSSLLSPNENKKS